jgi:hypothetical protein
MAFEIEITAGDERLRRRTTSHYFTMWTLICLVFLVSCPDCLAQRSGASQQSSQYTASDASCGSADGNGDQRNREEYERFRRTFMPCILAPALSAKWQTSKVPTPRWGGPDSSEKPKKDAEGYGVPATQATTAEELHQQFMAAMGSKGPHLIEAQVAVTIQPMVDQIRKERE